MIHILYKTTCVATNKFYIGIHSTTNIDDGYLGSGTRLKPSIKQYGRESHIREILSTADSRDQLLMLEEQLVNRELLADPLCLNLSIGGRAGIPECKFDESRSEKIRKALTKEENKTERSIVNSASAKKGWLKPGSKKQRQDAIAKTSATMWKRQELRDAMSERMKLCVGEKSSQYGTCWITKDGVSIKIKKDQLDLYLQQGYHRGRK